MAVQQHVEIPIDGPLVDADLPRRRLALVAEAAERLLAADDPARMVDELFVLIQAELRLDVFFNYRLENDRLVLEAHGGLSEAQARAGAELQLGQAVCGCAARDRQRFHVTGVQASEDPIVAFVRGIGLDAYACTPLLHGDTLMGTLGFGRRWADRFTDDELSFLHTLCHYVALAKYRLAVERDLRAGLEQRDRLLGELNHRVRNALQLAVSVVRLEASSATDPHAVEALAKVADRVEVIASAHRPIYAANDLRVVGLSDLLQAASAGLTIDRIALSGAPETRLPIEHGVALALLVHTIVADGSRAGEPVAIAIVEGADATATEVRVTGVDSTVQLLGGRLPQALLRQLGAGVAEAPGMITFQLPAASHD
ncbi:GAF domain-containing protein [Sphingomonas sp. PL-96]|nr:GAF domain-containing protein [Sphingomonas sp. PL-96]